MKSEAKAVFDVLSGLWGIVFREEDGQVRFCRGDRVPAVYDTEDEALSRLPDWDWLRRPRWTKNLYPQYLVMAVTRQQIEDYLLAERLHEDYVIKDDYDPA